MLADIPILSENPDVDRVADELIARSLIPAVAREAVTAGRRVA